MYLPVLEDVSHGILQKECVFNDSEDLQTYDDLNYHGRFIMELGSKLQNSLLKWK